MIAADTNLVAYLLIEGERTAAARRVWERDPDWVLPPLWRAECLNVLALAVRAGVLDEDAALLAWSRASADLKLQEVEPLGRDVLATALELGITAYDAHFVVVAKDLGIPLISGDRRLVAAWPQGATSIETFAEG